MTSEQTDLTTSELMEALHEGRRAIGEHYRPNDCYATGPMTGDPIRDLVECPACSFIALFEDIIAKSTSSAIQSATRTA